MAMTVIDAAASSLHEVAHLVNAGASHGQACEVVVKKAKKKSKKRKA